MIDAGTPLTELQPLSASNFQRKVLTSKPELCKTSILCHVAQSTHKNPAAITFVRNRMFYARAALNAKGRVTFGLRHIRKFGTTVQTVGLMCNRCLESVFRQCQYRAHSPCDEICVPEAIWDAQCLYLYSRLKGKHSAFQRLHSSRARNRSVGTPNTTERKR